MPRTLLHNPAETAAIRMEALRVSLGAVEILGGVDGFFARDAINALIGPNGAGKTTLLKALLDLVPYKGTIAFRAVEGRAPRLGYVPQRLEFDRGAPISVLDLLCADRQRRPLFFGHARRAVDAAREKLRLVGAERVLHAPLGRLSGGELQRVLVALALLGDPEILLLDEPVAGVDVAGEKLFCDLLVQLREQTGVTIVLVSHEMSIVVQHTDHVVCVSAGVVQCEGNPVATLNSTNIRRIFGEHAGIYEHGSHGHDAGHVHGPGCGHHMHPPATAPPETP